MKKLIIIPAFNEQESILGTVSRIRELAPDYDYIVVNDCSEDDTLMICRRNHIRVLNLPINLGIGGAVQTGYRYAYENGYEIAVQMDGDGQHDPAYLSVLEEALVKDGLDMVSVLYDQEGWDSVLHGFAPASVWAEDYGCYLWDEDVQPEGDGALHPGLSEGLSRAGDGGKALKAQIWCAGSSGDDAGTAGRRLFYLYEEIHLLYDEGIDGDSD